MWLTTTQIEMLINNGYLDYDDIPGWPCPEEKWGDEKGTVILIKVGQKISNLYTMIFGTDT